MYVHTELYVNPEDREPGQGSIKYAKVLKSKGIHKPSK